MTLLVVAVACVLLTRLLVQAQVAQQHKDVVYATVDGKKLGLDIYMPAGVQTPALLVWVHGGAWRSGTKERVPMVFVEHGIATASLDFRQSTEARFPAAVHDINAAIRFLRANASEYGYRTDRIAISGASSGGHLAALVGVTNGHTALEGTVGDHPGQSSDVQAIVSYFGASNLTTILAQSTPHGLNVREPALKLLLGALPESAKELAELASPVVVLDAPLVFEWGIEDWFARVFVISADADSAVARVAASRDMSVDEVRQRHRAQFSDARRPGAFEVVDNNGSLDDLRSMADKIWNDLTADAGAG